MDSKHLSDAEWVCNPKKSVSPSPILVPPERSPGEAVLEEAWIQSLEEITAKNCQLRAQLPELSSRNDRDRQTFSEGKQKDGKEKNKHIRVSAVKCSLKNEEKSPQQKNTRKRNNRLARVDGKAHEALTSHKELQATKEH